MSENLNKNPMVDNGMQTEEPKKNSKKGSKKSVKVDGKRIVFPEAKREYLETYKSKKCYNEEIYCMVCSCSFIKASEKLHQQMKKHLKNLQLYEDVKNDLEQKGITDDESINHEFRVKRGQCMVAHIVNTYGKKYSEHIQPLIKSH